MRKYKVTKSSIHGLGVVALADISPGERIGVGIKKIPIVQLPIITRDFGAWINHSSQANTKLQYEESTGYYLVVALVDIPTGGELTLNYNDTPWYIKGPDPSWT